MLDSITQNFRRTKHFAWLIYISTMKNDWNNALGFYVTGPGFDLPAHFSPIYFPMGNAATGFFVTFAMIAGVVGIASILSGFNHYRYWNISSMPGALSAATIAWTLTLLAMG